MIKYAQLPVFDVQPTLLVDLPCDTGEGPLWDDRTNTLTWNDIPVGTLYRYDPMDGTNRVVYQHHAAIGGHVLQEDGSLVLFCADGQILALHPNGTIETIIDHIPAVIGSRFNDVIADSTGSVYAGTMPLGANGDLPAHLYRLHTNGSLELVWDDLGLGNGMGFSPDERTFYHSDSNNRVVYRADYDAGTGAIANRSVLFALDDDVAVPDGMTVDANGDIWLAVWNGSCLLHYSAEGEPLGRVPFPVKKVSSINFGGDDFGTGFVTTAGGLNRDGDDGDLAGSLFAVKIPGVFGKSDYRSKIGL
ncbi:MAG: SMP-30/gluconolactonase/LRE family protein [Thermomicrobiales bacterium]|nr:SMP-30/gluconolactonase/LRE family protein [Thermomicrobiales bacterium]